MPIQQTNNLKNSSNLRVLPALPVRVLPALPASQIPLSDEAAEAQITFRIETVMIDNLPGPARPIPGAPARRRPLISGAFSSVAELRRLLTQ